MRVYPAYARTFAKYIARGVKPAAIGVLLSSRWGYFQTAPRVCIKPEEWAPGRWEFGYLRNAHVVAIWGDEADQVQFAQLLVELMAVGPRLLWLCVAGGEWLYKGDDAMAVHQYATMDIRGSLLEEKNAGREWRGPRFRDIEQQASAYEAARGNAIRSELKVIERLQEQGGDLVRWHTEQQAQLAFVEQLFSDPYAVPVDVAA